MFGRYFQEVLSSADTNEIQLNKDGSWSTHVVGSDAQSLDTPHKKYQSVDISDDTGKYSLKLNCTVDSGLNDLCCRSNYGNWTYY